MDNSRRDLVLYSIKEHCEYRAWLLFAAHIRTNHVHVILDAPVPPEKAMNELKAYASRKLNQARLDGAQRRRWSRHGSTRYLWSHQEVEAAIDYVADRQGETMAVYVKKDRW